MVWIKQRDDDVSNFIFDSVRGTTKWLKVDVDATETTDANSLTAFGSDGFTVGTGTSFNNEDSTYVAWCWKESSTAGFDIVTYTGDGSARTISHSLSAVPDLAIIRCRSDARSWVITNSTLGWTGRAFLDTSAAWGANSGEFNDTTPTSSVFTLGADYRTNKDTETYVAYLWRNVQGFFRTGTYKGTGSSANQGPFIYLGFKPAFLITKPSSEADAWSLWDNKRPGYNNQPHQLFAHASSAESSGAATKAISFTSNGFKIDGSDANELNKSGDTYIYMAWAESPLVNSNGVPNNAE